MPIAQSLLAEFEVQAPVTRKFLERLPEDKLTWKPHEKSMSATIQRKLQVLTFHNQRAVKRCSMRLKRASRQCGVCCQSSMTRP